MSSGGVQAAVNARCRSNSARTSSARGSSRAMTSSSIGGERRGAPRARDSITVSADEQAVRERVWQAMTDAKVVGFPGAKGRIPNFTGAADAARALAELDEWQAADTVKANPDMPPLPVRTRALADGKLLYLAVPRLRDASPFLLLDPDRLEVDPRAAASIKGSAVHGVPTAVPECRGMLAYVQRTTVKLPDELDARLRHEAARRGTTVSALTREAIEAHLGAGGSRRRLLAAGAGASGRDDISERIEAILRDEVGPSR